MSVAILSIGTEVVRGEIENTNTSWLCREVVGLGGTVVETRSVPDDAQVISETVLALMQKHDLVVSTGGLGPTTDDMTSARVAAALGVGLVRHVPSWETLNARYQRFGVTFTESNQKQADFPEGSQVLPNDWGTAPGFAVTHGKSMAFFFPGFPREMQPMFTRYVVPELRRRLGLHTAQVRLRTFGASESAVNDQLAGIEEEYGVSIGYRAHFPEIDVKPLATRDSVEAAANAARLASEAVRARLGSLVYGEGDAALPEVVLALLRERGLSFGLAESCSGGLIASLLTAQPCSDVFRGAVVSYDNAVKRDVLGVSQTALDTDGAVSEAVVREMATNARRVLGCDVALAVTGIAGPSGGTEQKPVGTVHFGVATPDVVVAHRLEFRWERVRVQLASAYHGLNLVRKLLLGIATNG